ncbi:glycerate kinase [Gudongella sp. DL1XJH-153]|uniref:glycerate kinase n=1 Tax=Gudongella sp. DL1XJH-153 TaxID=3409804 RepID=UPI003BB71E30
MKIVIAHCGLGEVMTPENTVAHIEAGIKASMPMAKISGYPLLNGDSPLAQVTAFGGEIVIAGTVDPYYRKIDARYGIVGGDQVVIDLTEASGLERLQEDERNPLLTTTYGTGLLIKDALDRGLRDFYIFTRGSSTNDGGVGLLSALGYRFLDREGDSITLNGSGLYSIREIDTTGIDERIKEARFTLVTDYTNLYSGVRGIAYEYGPLKGASPLMIQSLDRGLRNYAMEVEKATGVDVDRIKGTGAGGGTGAGVVAFLKAEVVSFIESFVRMTGVYEEIRDADLVIAGSKEVRNPRKMHRGMMATVEMAQKNHVPVVGVFGSLSKGYDELYSKGFRGIYALFNHPYGEGAAWDKPEEVTERMIAALAHLFASEEEL